MRFSSLTPVWLISCYTITFQKYFWCSWFCWFDSNDFNNMLRVSKLVGKENSWCLTWELHWQPPRDKLNTTTSKLKNIGSSSIRDARKCSFRNGLSCGVYIHIQTSSQLCCKILQISCNKKNHKITVIQHANWHDPNIRKKSARLPFYSTVHVNNLCPRYLM